MTIDYVFDREVRQDGEAPIRWMSKSFGNSGISIRIYKFADLSPIHLRKRSPPQMVPSWI